MLYNLQDLNQSLFNQAERLSQMTFKGERTEAELKKLDLEIRRSSEIAALAALTTESGLMVLKAQQFLDDQENGLKEE